MIHEKLASFLTKIIMIPIFFFLIYLLVFVLGVQLVGRFETKDNSIVILFGAIIVANIIAFGLTYLIHFIYKKCWEEINFVRWFHFTHLLYIYLSGIASAVISFESILLKNKILTSSIDDNYKIVMFVFVVILSNYTFYKSLALDDDFRIKKS